MQKKNRLMVDGVAVPTLDELMATGMYGNLPPPSPELEARLNDLIEALDNMPPLEGVTIESVEAAFEFLERESEKIYAQRMADIDAGGSF
ncbi:MAG: hypothetical protein KU37_03985 [Sulfuricurvum sp. PC08-66]|nr:MAG: hypothetical protein KU37_03985 [Sulfuricurvum sp. PC08-66]